LTSLEGSQFSTLDLIRSNQTVSVCIPARNEEATVGSVVSELKKLKDIGAIEELTVIDDRSTDRTAEVAQEAGATVFTSSSLMSSFGECLGKGDAMWRAQEVLKGDVVCFIDADIQKFSNAFVTGLAGALITDTDLQLVKAKYRRPLCSSDGELLNEGGRVNALLARPLLRSFYPDIAWLSQPLSGEVAVRRSTLEKLEITCGYGVEIGMLVDTCKLAGSEAIAEVDLGTRYHRNRQLSELSLMADEVLAAVLHRADRSKLQGTSHQSRPAMKGLVTV